MWEWILRIWNNGGRKIKLDHTTYMTIGSLSRNSAFNVAVQGVRKSCNSMFG